LRDIVDGTGASGRLVVCLDTSHVYEAGYDISTGEGYERTMQELDTVVGLDRLKVVHLNDSKKGFGSRVDRHEHIGRGAIGLEAFRLVVTDRRLRELPMFLETPKGKVGRRRWDAVNLGILKRLRSQG
jgi:deoxyribonuclease-4